MHRPLLPATLTLLALVSLVPAAPPGLAQGDPVWGGLQGGPSHAGVAAGPEPPYATRWSVPAGRSGDRGAAGAVLTDYLAIALGREEVVAVSLDDGEMTWALARVPGPPTTPALAPDGSLLVYPEGERASNAAVVAVRLEDRSVRWRFRPGAVVRAAPTFAEDGVFVASSDGTLSALDPSDGSRRWAFEAGGRIHTSPAVANGLALVVSENFDEVNATLHAVDAQTGRERWRLDPPGRNIFVSGVATGDDVAFVALGDGSVRAIDTGAGTERWRANVRTQPTGLQFSASSVPAISGDTLVVADLLGSVWCLDATTGRERWRYRYPSSLAHGSPLIVGEHVVVPSGAGRLAAIAVDSGDQVWSGRVRTGAVSSFASDGEVLVVGTLGRGGGLAALEHDPAAPLTSVGSPASLDVGRALGNFALAAAALLLLLFLVFRLVVRQPRAAPQPEGFR